MRSLTSALPSWAREPNFHIRTQTCRFRHGRRGAPTVQHRLAVFGVALLAILVTFAGWYPSAGWTVEIGPATAAELQTQLANLRSEIAGLAAHPAPPVLSNAGFENGRVLGAEGWQCEPAAGAAVQIDATHAQTGRQSIHLSSRGHVDWAGPVVSLRSGSVDLPATRRLAVTAWMRVDPAAPPATVWLVMEGKYQGQPFSHHVEVGSNAQTAGLPPLGSDWKPVTLQLDELPTDGITDLRVGVDLRGAGDVWVDRFQIHDMWLTDAELEALLTRVDKAQASLAAGELTAVQQLVGTELQEELSKFAATDYLVPSLATAGPAVAAAIQLESAVTAPVGRAVAAVANEGLKGRLEDAAAEDVLAAAAKKDRYAITPIRIDEPTAAESISTAAGQPPATDEAQSRPTVLVAKSASDLTTAAAAADPFRTTSLVTTHRAIATSLATTTPVATATAPTTAAVNETTAAATNDRPWWKVWPSRSMDQTVAQQQMPRSMPGTPRVHQRAAGTAVAAATESTEKQTVSLPRTAFRRIRERFHRDDVTEEPVAAAPATAAITPAESESSWTSHLRWPFFGKDDKADATPATAAQPTTDDERRFRLFGMGRDDATDSTATVAPERSTLARLNPVNLLKRGDGKEADAAEPVEKSDSRLASLRNLFHSEDDSQTVQR